MKALFTIKKKYLNGIFFWVFLILFSNTASAVPLTGVKTIGGSSPDYATLAAAITDLNTNGVGAGGVTFNFRNGTYPGGTAISSVTAVGSASNPVVFQSENGDSSLVIISSNTSSNVVTVSGGAYITFKKITVDYTGSSSYAALKLALNADNITVTNCILDGTSATGTTYAASVIYGSESSAANNCDNFHLYNSVVRYGSYGVYLSMTSATQSTGIIVQGNKFSENAAGGVYLTNHAYVIINANNISRSITANTYYGIYANNCDSASQITRNYIYSTGSGTVAYGIYLNGSSASKTGNSNLSDNSIQVANGASSCYGIDQNSTSSFWNIFNNTVYVSASTSSSSYCYRTFASNDSTKLINNIFIHAGTNTGSTANQTVYIANASGVKQFKNNCYYTVNTGNPFRAYRSISYTVYSTYASAVGETNGLNIDPSMSFIAGVGWKATNASLTGAGLYQASVPDDIDGKTRISPNTTIGAHENGVISTPTIIVSTTSLTPFSTIYPTPSSAQTYTVEGQYLTDDLVVTAPANFEVREQGVGSFGSSVSFTPVGGMVSTKTIEARYNPASPGSHFGDITHTSTGATQKDVSVTGSSTHYMCGNYTVGADPGNDYQSLAEAMDALNLAIVTCDIIFELQTDYNGVGETCPISINQFTTSGGNWKVIVRPASDVVSMLTSSGDPGSANSFIVFNGTDRMTFDGRPGGSGTSVLWTIQNYRTASEVGPAIKFTNEATYDTLQYVRIESQNSTSTSGTIYISGYPAWSAGNNHITIQNCDITKYSSGGTTHVNAVYAYGETAYPNSYINILNNNIHSFTPGLNYEATGVTVTGTGINTNYGDNWTITGNSFYLDCAEQQYYRYTVINLTPGLGSDNNIISGNYIGGSAPLCGGSAWTSAVGGAGNTIQTFEGIYVWAGSTTISDNTVQNISLTATGGTSFGAVHLADCNTSDTYFITDNLIGSDEVCNSIQNAGQWKTVGIWIDNTCGDISTTNNIIANITATNAVNDAATVTGIYSDCGSNTITGNTIFNLTATVANSTPNLYIAHDGSVVGIADKSIYSGTTQNISNNIIFNMKSLYSGSGNNKLYGIYTAIGEPGQIHTYNANTIFGFDADNSSSNAMLTGIGSVGSSWASAVTSVFSNNMISLGLRIDGSSVTSGAEITGILDNTSGYTSGSNTTYMNYYYNSVYIGGTGVTGTTNNTYAYRRNNTNISPKNTEDLKDNLFINNRANSSGTKSHYSIYLDNTSYVSSNYNDGWGNGSGYLFGNAASTDYNTLPAWQTGTSLDAQSANADPLYVSPSSAVPDLHIQTGSPVIGIGTNVSITTDFDAESRTNPYDMGADEYNGSYSSPGYTVDACAGFQTPCTPPTITLSNSPAPDTASVCYSAGSQTADFNYSATTESPTMYSITGWSGGSFSEVIDQSLPASPIGVNVPAGTAAGSYTATLTVASATCTSIGYTITVTVNSLPQGSLSGNTICTGGTGQFTFTSSAGTGPFSLIINGTTYNNVVNATPFNANPNPGSTTAYTLTSITDANGCVRTSGITGPSATITVNTLSTDPTNINASANPICNGSSTTLTVSGGSLGTGATWQWYSGTCGGTPEGTGSSISVSPTSATSYFVLAEGSCNTTSCATLDVNVDVLSVAPSGINASVNPVCNGSSTTLTVSGGSLGTGATWQWYSGTCGGTPEGTGSSISVSPTSATSYFVLAEGNCNTTSCATLDVNVEVLSAAPSGINASENPVCSGSSTTLTVSGGSLGTGATWQWYSGTCGGTPEGTGSSISVSPTSATSYFVLAEGNCNTTSCATLLISVNPLPVMFSVNGGGAYCSGGTAVNVGLDGSASGVNYQLLYSGSPLWLPLPGTGSAVSFGPQIQAGNYTVLATDATTACQNNMSGDADISIYNCSTSDKSVAVNRIGSTADSSAIFDVSDTVSGVLFPRLSDAQRNSLDSPDVGLLIYNTTSGKLNFYKSTGWYEIGNSFITFAIGTNAIDYGVSVNATGNNALQSSMLDVSSTIKGVLIPRTLPGAVYGVAEGSVIYNIHSGLLNYYDGSSWVSLSGSFVTSSVGGGSQSVSGTAVNQNNFNPAPSAILDISAQNKGLLIPRLTDAQRNQINPATGLIIYNKTSKTIEYYNGAGWYQLQ